MTLNISFMWRRVSAERLALIYCRAMSKSPVFEFHVSRGAREKYSFDNALFSISSNVVFANVAASREFAQRMNEVRDSKRYPELAVNPGALNAMGLIDEALHALVGLYREQRDPRSMLDALAYFEARLGRESLDRTLLAFADEFPTVAVYRRQQTAKDWLAGSTGDIPHRAVALEELLMLWLANLNPAFRPFGELFDDRTLKTNTAYSQLTSGIRDYFETRPRFGPENENLIDALRAPAMASPDSLEGQLAYLREKWSTVLGEMIRRLLRALDVLKEEQVAIWMRFHPPAGPFGGGAQLQGDSSVAAIPLFGQTTGGEPEYERFSPDVDWMPRTVMMAKSVYVWLDQLSKTYRREIRRLNEVPDEELNLMARRGFSALWLIGIWERSKASKRIKQLTGNPEAAASAYSLYDYVIAEDLGGESAYANLRDRAQLRGIRLASDMVPNHMGIDSRWVIEHPGWFVSLPQPPYPAYAFEGPDLSNDGRVEIKIEDHYFNRTDAAVVFRRVDRWSGDTRYIYHGNDGTSFPWNDTAQLNYLNPEVREAVIQTILHVARLFPIIRFDAAMTLAKQHYQRLWFPVPGTGGAIPSRAEHGLTKAEFDAAMPQEFWRELVDRVAAEVPGTLLLAEAFWLLEGYFVRTLGMHRVYNSAFMNMLRDEENANYRKVIKNTLEFDPDVLKRYVNFMNNPDERTAVDQFGKGDKYFGVCTLLATLPGLPMFGHGQIEGFTERYGMEYQRAYYEETPDTWLVARHEREISPLLHRRALFAEVENFLLYDFFTNSGYVNEDVFAYSNRRGNERALIVYNNRYNDTSGWIRMSCAYAEKANGGKHLRQKTIADALDMPYSETSFVAYRDAFTGLEYLRRTTTLHEKGLYVELGAYKCLALLDWIDLREDDAHPWGQLCNMLAGRGVSSLQDALQVLRLKPAHDRFRDLLKPTFVETLAKYAAKNGERESRGVEPTPVEKRVSTGAANAQKGQLSAELISDMRSSFTALMNAVRQLSTSSIQKDGRTEMPRSSEWQGGEIQAAERFEDTLRSALRLSGIEGQFSKPWPPEGLAVLPSSTAEANQCAIWATVFAWCALQGLGYAKDPANANHAAARLVDEFRLREPMAQAFESYGLAGEKRWQAAARVRTLLAHASWAPGAEQDPRNTAPLSWMHDPEVAWLINVHEYQGVQYFGKEPFEQLLWWMSLPKLLRIAAAPAIDPKAVAELEQEIQLRTLTAAQAGYRVDGLLEQSSAPAVQVELSNDATQFLGEMPEETKVPDEESASQTINNKEKSKKTVSRKKPHSRK
ncbi:MAG TPA: alpha-amylase family glycosyl hydrolase [Terriglobales bacterium]|nr:alpha-amylase family glycosyl hydrolase [Terriglobales bacterium]